MLVSVIGQIVVEISIVTIVKIVDWAGQFSTVEAQLIIVEKLVARTVDVVN